MSKNSCKAAVKHRRCVFANGAGVNGSFEEKETRKNRRGTLILETNDKICGRMAEEELASDLSADGTCGARDACGG